MDNANIGGAKQGVHGLENGLSTSFEGIEAAVGSARLQNGSAYINGARKPLDGSNQASAAGAVSTITKDLPELTHITQGFFPFTTLVNRSVQQCWNDLSDLVTELAEIQVSPQDHASSTNSFNAKSPGNQCSENVHKKLRMLEFAHGKRAEFIKLLVLSQWSRHAVDVSKLIDLQSFIRTRHQAYVGALQWVGDMKRDLVRAQVANPDLRTALEVLCKGKVAAMSDLGYKPPKPLSVKATLKKLQKINRIISVRLSLHDAVPRAFQTYLVHDGRVTFFVPAEFELDLSVGEDDKSSQFFFVDIRFLFSPSSPIPKGRILNELDAKINDVLRDKGLSGCFDLLHSLVLTNKINVLHKQAIELTRGLWSDVLRVELLHRTLVVQYWASKPGVKNWLEIGIKSGRRGDNSGNSRCHGMPYLDLRWMRGGQETDNRDIEFDTESLAMESILRSAIALHISHILSSAYTNIGSNLLFSTGVLYLRAQLSGAEPGDCQLDVQLTSSRHLRVSIEPMSGASIFSATPSVLSPENDRSSDKSAIDEMVSRISRLRCIAAIEEIESNVRMLGFETVSPRGLKIDVRRLFPSNVLRFSLFSHRLWNQNWVVAATSSMDNDNWWMIQVRPSIPSQIRPGINPSTHGTSILRSTQVVSTTFLTAQEKMIYTSLADLGHCLTGILTVYSNARYLAELQCIHFYPPLQRLQIATDFRVPDIIIRYNSSNLPPTFQIALPAGLKKKSFIKNTVRLAFHGIDPRKNAAIVVGYGNLLVSSKSFGTLVAKSDHSLVFQQKGNGFAIRLLAPAGQPVILDLIEKLQRLECALSILETLRQKKMAPRSFSLSRIAFVYGPERNLAASLDIKISGPPSLADVNPADIVPKVDRLFHIHLGINFDFPNPHRRIQESLTAILNHSSADAGLDSVVEILPLTLPLLLALDRITSNPSHKGALRVQITARSAKTFQIHYPIQRFRFQLIAGQHLSRIAWILKDVSGSQARKDQDQLVSKLQDELYNSKGNGWKGLGNGVVAEVEKVGNLISKLDRCFADVADCPGTGGLVDKDGPGNPTSISQATSNQADSTGARTKVSIFSGASALATSLTSRNPLDASNNADVIMID
ncbi:hypothetical protein ASPWEDRAFT_172526 [Aspergillus wentii DTO 134E9]|uniref:Mediator of RNA polymerase II transcription subunit 14 n=1 Tax=Aspergillus wentii DTO 134E9 TaxID=1073089 RepID=A0A1L9RLB7_ASPWE|nr:uncharacterized protein ASPWEDRAFT_172526 [Aspergillus wentii DTO 134E9]OJJ35729.1 hypothetical protein ASPWEDRAFT_172526 [Aspergillus wentii DTO 134E9]